MHALDADDPLAEADLVPYLEGSLAYAKEVHAACLAADIPAAIGRDACCGGGCGPKVQLLVRPEDVPRVAELLQRRFREMVGREGTVTPIAHPGVDDEPPCPCCGATGELVDGACHDCGLTLA